MPTLCRGTHRDLALLSALGCGSGATAVPGRAGALGHPLATLPQAELTSSPALPSCGTPALQLHLLFSSFFPLHFFSGGRGEEGAGGPICHCGCWVIKPCTNLCTGLPAPPSPGVERVLGTRSQAESHSGTSQLAQNQHFPLGETTPSWLSPPRQMG